SISPYAARRTPLVAGNGVVAASQPLAAQAGLAILQAGGSAGDAGVATGIPLTGAEATPHGIGGGGSSRGVGGAKLRGGSGACRAGAAWTVEAVRRAGNSDMPATGWLPVTVPGAPAAWQDLHARFGKLPFARLFEPAIAYAERGHPVAPIVARNWARAVAIA